MSEAKRSWQSWGIEIAAVILTLASVWLTAEEQITCWPVGIAGCLLYGYVFYQARLYSDVLLQAYFLVTSFTGWYNWLYGGVNGSELSTRFLSSREIAIWAVVFLAGIATLGTFMKRKTAAALPYWDASTTVLSFIAQYLLTLKIVENWALWIVADVIDTGIYFRRKLYATSLLYATLLLLAIRGLVTWLHQM